MDIKDLCGTEKFQSHMSDIYGRYSKHIVVDAAIWLINFRNKKIMDKKKKSEAKVEKVMHEYKEGKLHRGSKNGPEVNDRKQPVFIFLTRLSLSKSQGKY